MCFHQVLFENVFKTTILVIIGFVYIFKSVLWRFAEKVGEKTTALFRT